MCGLFGFVSKNGNPFDLDIIKDLARVTESRGPHSFGFAWVDARNRLRMFKQEGRITDYLSVLSIARDARMLIGHCRFATHGNPSNNLNNHPHPCDGGWLTHNGVIRNNETINEDYCLNPVTDCDSESLAMMVEEFDGTLTDRCIAATSVCEGPLAMMGLWRKKLVAIRSGNPLHIGSTKSAWYMASLPHLLPGTVIPVKDEHALEFVSNNGKATVTSYELSSVSLSV